MNYKVLVKLLVPEIEKSYEIYIPINRTVKDVCRLVNELVHDDTSGIFPIKDDIVLLDRFSTAIYPYDTYIRDTNIRNGSQIVLI